jgi:peptidoglycan hydrolase-like protein with peptidoglycan-binding domain
MKITGRQLRQIISEEIRRSKTINEGADYVGGRVDELRQDALDADTLRMLDTAGEDLEDAPDAAVAMPKGEDAVTNVTLGSPKMRDLARFKSEMLVRQQAPEYYDEVKGLIATPAVLKELTKIFNGSKVLQVGSTGPDVKVYQAVVLANLRMWIKMHRGETSISTSAEEIANKAIRTNGDVTDEDLRAAVYDILTLSDFEPDGKYGAKTQAAVALLQTIMDRKQIIVTAGGPEAEWRGVVDGKIGRQTAHFLSGFTILAPVSGVTSAEAGGKWMGGRLATGGGVVKESASLDRWKLLAGIDKA